jgi:hypothetical protein
MNLQPLTERLSFDQAGLIVETIEDGNDGGKNLYMKGIFIQGDKVNHNERVYPADEISRAVESISQRLGDGFSVLGEADHPDDLQVNIDRVSHMVTKMWMQGSDGYGQLKIIPTPMGNIIKTLLEAKVKLGVSSRGSGNVGAGGKVSEFEIVTVDVVAQPSAPDAYPTPIYERVMQDRRRAALMDVALATTYDKSAQKHLEIEVLRFLENLKKV